MKAAVSTEIQKVFAQELAAIADAKAEIKFSEKEIESGAIKEQEQVTLRKKEIEAQKAAVREAETDLLISANDFSKTSGPKAVEDLRAALAAQNTKTFEQLHDESVARKKEADLKHEEAMLTAKSSKFAEMFGGYGNRTTVVKNKMEMARQITHALEEQQSKFERDNKELQDRHDAIVAEQRKRAMLSGALAKASDAAQRTRENEKLELEKKSLEKQAATLAAVHAKAVEDAKTREAAMQVEIASALKQERIKHEEVLEQERKTSNQKARKSQIATTLFGAATKTRHQEQVADMEKSFQDATQFAATERLRMEQEFNKKQRELEQAHKKQLEHAKISQARALNVAANAPGMHAVGGQPALTPNYGMYAGVQPGMQMLPPGMVMLQKN